MRKEIVYCDYCGVELSGGREDQLAPNVDVIVGVFRTTIAISKSGIMTDLCRGCRIKIVSDAILERDPYATQAGKS